MEGYTPEIPQFIRGPGRDGKYRLYLMANNEADIVFMLDAAGLKTHGVTRQNDKYLNAYYRIIKKWEEPIIKKVFP